MSNQPDVLILMTDQHNPAYVGYAVDPIVQTPNIDRIASEGKGHFYKESGGIPFVMRWPNHVQAGQHTSAFAKHIDVGATILDAINTERTEGHYGVSLMPVESGESEEVHDAVFSEIGSGQGYRYMVCTERYKWWIDRNKEYLFDVVADPGEMNNIAEGYSEICGYMGQRLLQFYIDTPFD